MAYETHSHCHVAWHIVCHLLRNIDIGTSVNLFLNHLPWLWLLHTLVSASMMVMFTFISVCIPNNACNYSFMLYCCVFEPFWLPFAYSVLKSFYSFDICWCFLAKGVMLSVSLTLLRAHTIACILYLSGWLTVDLSFPSSFSSCFSFFFRREGATSKYLHCELCALLLLEKKIIGYHTCSEV